MLKLWYWFMSFFSSAYLAPEKNEPGYAAPVAPPEDTHERYATLLSVPKPSFIERALATVGRRESTHISWIMNLFRATSYSMKLVNKTTAWCAAWVDTMLEEAGYKQPRSAAAKSQSNLGVAMSYDEPFGVCVWQHMTGSMKGRFHTNFSLEAPGSSRPRACKCVGGNQGNAVSIAYYGWPAYQLYAYRKPVKK